MYEGPKVRVTDKQFLMDETLLYHLDSICQDADEDQSFVIAISGDGRVRVGKSKLGKQVGYYLAWRLGRTWDEQNAENIIFSGSDLIKKGKEYGIKKEKMIFVYDEARGETNNKIVMSQVSRNLEDYFATCGKYNHIVILILPDYFELNKRYAINHTEFLINVYIKMKKVPYKYDNTREVLTRERGHFAFFARRKKKLLYIFGQDTLNYNAQTPDFIGTFTDFDTVNKEAYEKKKDDFLQKEAEQKSKPGEKYMKQRNKLLYILNMEMNMPQKALAQYLTKNGYPVSQKQVSNILGLSNSNEQKYNIMEEGEEA